MSICLSATICTFSSCTFQLTHHFIDKLKPEELYLEYNTIPKDLKAISNCEQTPSINIISSETRDSYNIPWGPYTYHVIPSQLMEKVADYMRTGFAKTGVRPDSSCPKTIRIFFEEIKFLKGFWVIGGFFRMKVAVPEIGYTQYYEAEEWSGSGALYQTLNSIHISTQKVIDDPVIQGYILCRDENIRKKQSLADRLQELREALDRKLISSDEYESARQRLIESY